MKKGLGMGAGLAKQQYLLILSFTNLSFLSFSKGLDLIFIDSTTFRTHLLLVFVEIKLHNYNIIYNGKYMFENKYKLIFTNIQLTDKIRSAWITTSWKSTVFPENQLNTF